jgi:hypothetical protein
MFDSYVKLNVTVSPELLPWFEVSDCEILSRIVLSVKNVGRREVEQTFVRGVWLTSTKDAAGNISVPRPEDAATRIKALE